MSENRKVIWIQNLRAICCMLIVLLHIVDGWLKSNTIELAMYSGRWWLDNVFIQVFVKSAVPIFIMISGTLLLNPEKELKLEKIIKYIIRMVLIIISFGLFYCLIEQFVYDKFSNPLKSIGLSILHVFENKSWGIMWYMYMMIGLYALTPMIKTFVNNTNDKTLIFTLIVLFTVSSIVPTINYLLNVELTTFYLDGFIFVFYYMMGYCIAYKMKLWMKKTKTKTILYMIEGFSLIGYLCWLIFLNGYYDYTKLNTNNNFFVVMWSIFIYYLFSNEIIKIKECKILNYIAKYSFGIFLIHTFWLNVINKGLNIYPDILPTGIGEFTFFIGIMIVSIISCAILYRIPIFNKILK